MIQKNKKTQTPTTSLIDIEFIRMSSDKCTIYYIYMQKRCCSSWPDEWGRYLLPNVIHFSRRRSSGLISQSRILFRWKSRQFRLYETNKITTRFQLKNAPATAYNHGTMRDKQTSDQNRIRVV